QTELTGEFEALVETAGAVLEQGGGFGRLRGMEEGVVLAGAKRWAVEERDDLVQDSGITRSIHVGRRRKCQPDAVVRNPRADALPRLRQPPMLNVAFAELSTGRTQEMASRLFGFC